MNETAFDIKGAAADKQLDESDALKRNVSYFLIGVAAQTILLVLLYFCFGPFWIYVALIPISALCSWLLKLRRSSWAIWVAATSVSVVLALGLCYILMGALLCYNKQGSPPFVAGSIEARGSVLSLRGNILPETRDQWHEALAMIPSGRPTTVRLNSPGGDLHVAREIARDIAAFGTTVEVPAGRRCESSCVAIFAAGATRLADPTAVFMFHATAAPIVLPYMQPLRVRKAWSGADTLADDLNGYPGLRDHLVKLGVFNSLEPKEISAIDIPKTDPLFLRTEHIQ
ncbi:hypothetical protein [Rhizobium laguerreae]|uniref:hypothetical protein n=1 Tax=Rhizobium laguerreae TaxID=1076926 RepID=UPI00138A0E19|nr:hypothetical protein [Rhizobium laguerreae]NDK52858.1 hypothetical protein [Rhizobium laguerreae]